MSAKQVTVRGKNYTMEAVDTKHVDLQYQVYVRTLDNTELVAEYLVNITTAGVDVLRQKGQLPEQNGNALREKALELASEQFTKGVYNKKITVTSNGTPEIEDLPR